MESKRIVASIIALVGACSLVVSCSPQVNTASSPESAETNSPSPSEPSTEQASLDDVITWIKDSNDVVPPDLARQLQAYGPEAVAAVQQEIDTIDPAWMYHNGITVAYLLAALSDDQRSQLDLTKAPPARALPAYYWFVTGQFLGDRPDSDDPDVVAGFLFDMLTPDGSGDGVVIATMIVGKLWQTATLEQAKQMGVGLRQLMDTVWVYKTENQQDFGVDLAISGNIPANPTAAQQALIWACFGPAYLALSMRYQQSGDLFDSLMGQRAVGWSDFWSALADAQRLNIQYSDPYSKIYVPLSIGSDDLDKLAAKKWSSGGSKPKPGGWLFVIQNKDDLDGVSVSQFLTWWKPTADQASTAAYDSASLRSLVIYKYWWEDVSSHYNSKTSSGKSVVGVGRCNITVTGVNMSTKSIFYQKTFKPSLPDKVTAKTLQYLDDMASATIDCLDNEADSATYKLLDSVS